MASSSSSCAFLSLNSHPPTLSSPFPSRYATVSSLQFSSSSSHQLKLSGPSCSRPNRLITTPNSPFRFRVFCGHGLKAEVVTSKSWDKLILKSEKPVLVEFYASWCGPCTMVHRVIDEIAAEYAGKLNCFVLHADSELQIADDYDIKAVPVVLLFKNGKKLESVVGTMPKEFYVAAIERVFAS